MYCRIIFILCVLVYHIDAACYPTGSRCVPERPFQTAIAWNSCQHYCNKCKGLTVGDCERVFTPLCDGKYQCKCAGEKIPASANILERATCQLGI
ncbi:unnamed protein product [Auanema sp. JU1783]|nr:unnamed protein product [Auanema sp. JU1783]